MKFSLRSLLLLLLWQGLFASWGHAQLSPYATFSSRFADAEELFQKGMYGSAQLQLEAFMRSEQYIRLAPDNDLRARARLMEAASAYYLQRANAEGLLRAFASEYAESTLYADGSYYLGRFYFEKKNYRDAIPAFLAAYQSGSLAADFYFETVFKLGYAYFETGNDNQAVRFFDICAARNNPYREDAQYYRAIIYYRMSNFPQAYQAFKDLENSPKYGRETKVYLGYTLYKLGRFEELAQMAEQVASSPRDQEVATQIYYLMANAAYERLQYAQSADYYDRYVRARGRMERADHFRLGFSLFKMERYLDAIPALERAVTSKMDTTTQAASYYLGFCFLKKPDPVSARFAFQKASAAGAGLHADISRDALYQYAKVAFSTESYAEAQQALIELQQKYPNESFAVEARELLGETYLYTRDYGRSIEYFEQQANLSPRARKAYQSVLYFNGLDMLSRRDYPAAEVSLQKSALQNQDPATTLDASYWLAEARFRRGNTDDARRQYESYQRLPGAQQHSQYAASFYGLGWCEFKARRWSQAIQQFDRYLNLTRSGAADRDMVVDATLRAGDAYFVQTNYAQADAYYNRAVGLRHTFQDYALFQLGESQYRQNNYRPAVQTFDRLINQFPQSDQRPRAIDRVSDIYGTWLNDRARSVTYANMLVREYPRNQLTASAYNRLAIAAYERGEEAQSISFFKKVLSDYDNEQAAQVALDNLDGLLSPDEFSKVFAAYRAKRPGNTPSGARQVFDLAKGRFLAGQYDAAITLFSDYIRDNPNGEFVNEALFLRGRSNRNSNRLTAALDDFQKVYSTPSINPFTEQATQEAAEIKFDQKDYQASLTLYQSLDRLAGKTQVRVAAKMGLAANYRALKQFDKAIVELLWVERNNEVQQFSRNRATVELGYNYYEQGNLDKALESFRSVIRDTKDLLGAESQFMVIQILYDQRKYDVLKANVTSMNNEFSTADEWRARAFLVLAEVNVKEGNLFQAKGTLESISKDSRFPEIQAQAKRRLEEIERLENSNN